MFVSLTIQNASDMHRPKGLALSAALMAICNAMLWVALKPTRPPYTLRLFASYTVVIIVGYVFIWFYWKGKNWARITVLLFSGLFVLNLGLWNTVARTAAFRTMPAHILMASRAGLAAVLLYWLNTRRVREFFARSNKEEPAASLGR